MRPRILAFAGRGPTSQNPGQIDMRRVDSQQARRVLDRIVGYQISPLLWKKLRGARSAGRVQSVAVRLIVERERDMVHSGLYPPTVQRPGEMRGQPQSQSRRPAPSP